MARFQYERGISTVDQAHYNPPAPFCYHAGGDDRVITDRHKEEDQEDHMVGMGTRCA